MEFNRSIVLTLVAAIVALVGGCYTAFNYRVEPPPASVSGLFTEYGCDATCNKQRSITAVSPQGVGGQPVGGRPAEAGSLGRETESITKVVPQLELECVYISPDGLSMWLNEDATRIEWRTTDCEGLLRNP